MDVDGCRWGSSPCAAPGSLFLSVGARWVNGIVLCAYNNAECIFGRGKKREGESESRDIAYHVIK